MCAIVLIAAKIRASIVHGIWGGSKYIRQKCRNAANNKHLALQARNPPIEMTQSRCLEKPNRKGPYVIR